MLEISTKALFVNLAFLFFLGPVPCQAQDPWLSLPSNLNREQEEALFPLTSAPLLAAEYPLAPVSLVAAAVPLRPVDPQVEKVIRREADQPKDTLRLVLVDGRNLNGHAVFLAKDFFEFFPENSTTGSIVYFRDVFSATAFKPKLGERVKEALEIAGMVAGLIALFPLELAWGISCNFQCS